MRDLLRVRKIEPELLKQFLDQKVPESEWLEYKREVNDKLVEAIAAMANGDGGVIIVGVEQEDGRPKDIVGLPEGEGAEMKLVHMCRDRLDPARYPPEIQRIQVAATNGPKDLLVVRVDPERVPIRPVIVRKDRGGKVYIRYGPSTIEADPRTLRQLFAFGSQAISPLSKTQVPLEFFGPDQQTQSELVLLIQVA